MTCEKILSDTHPDLTSWRRQLHRNPEFGFDENQTADFIVRRLREMGVNEIEQGIGGTGVVATLRAGSSNKAIGFRADMDALRIDEANDFEHRSEKPGLMHACGHDGHVTMLLGAAHELSQSPDFDGIIRLIFQPAEEWGKGMQAMLDNGLLERFPFEEAYGVHNMPGLPIGDFATAKGPIMGAEDLFTITVTGRGGHSSRPHESNDALVAACAIVVALQTIVSRRIDPSQLAVVSVTEVVTDGTRNTIPGCVQIHGDARHFDTAVSDRIEAEMRRISHGVAGSYACNCEVSYSNAFIPLINDAAMTENALAAATAATQGNVDGDMARMGASEDFARLLNHVPGNFMMIGNGPSLPLHNSGYDFNDAALPYGIRYFAELARQRLPQNLS
ncbi:MAG: M20 aminoacylase family protein [Pseudomonadota bacterium]